MSVFTRNHGEYEISDDPARLDLDAVERLLHGTYWAWDRPRATIEKSIANSICLGAYRRGTQVGFGRIVTDGATFAWICDIIVDEGHRGSGLGKVLVESVILHPKVADLRQVLATKDAHSLYEKFGYERRDGVFLTRNFLLRPD